MSEDPRVLTVALFLPSAQARKSANAVRVEVPPRHSQVVSVLRPLNSSIQITTPNGNPGLYNALESSHRKTTWIGTYHYVNSQRWIFNR
jgi:hypothetical protein